MKETILSVGIDIGTSTTQLIFSKLTIENEASSYVVPRINIVDKEVSARRGTAARGWGSCRGSAGRPRGWPRG